MKLNIMKAETDVTVYVWIADSSSTTGAGLTGLAFNTASLTAYYVRPLGSNTVITLATQTVTGAHSDGGFVEVSSANMPGLYRLDLPDAVCATGVPGAVVLLKGAANMAPVVLEIQLVDYDPDAFNTYQAKIDVVDDNGGSNDRYIVTWFKNGQPVISGITSPLIQTIKAADGTDLVASTAMTQIASTGLYRYDEGTNRMVDGVAYVAKATGTIDGSARTWYQPVGRDSA